MKAGSVAQGRDQGPAPLLASRRRLREASLGRSDEGGARSRTATHLGTRQPPPAFGVRRTRTHPAPLGSTAGLSIAIACQPIKRRSTGIARSGSNVHSNKKLGTYRGGRADRQQQTSSQGMEKDEQKDERGQDSARARDTWLNASAATWLRKRRHCRGVPGENLHEK